MSSRQALDVSPLHGLQSLDDLCAPHKSLSASSCLSASSPTQWTESTWMGTGAPSLQCLNMQCIMRRWAGQLRGRFRRQASRLQMAHLWLWAGLQGLGLCSHQSEQQLQLGSPQVPCAPPLSPMLPCICM